MYTEMSVDFIWCVVGQLEVVGVACVGFVTEESCYHTLFAAPVGRAVLYQLSAFRF